jgi:uncharacterized membrane protein
MSEEEQQALELARERVLADMPYVHVDEVRLYQYHYLSNRFYVEVDITHHDEEQGSAMVLVRVSRHVSGFLEAQRVTVVEKVRTAIVERQTDG